MFGLANPDRFLRFTRPLTAVLWVGTAVLLAIGTWLSFVAPEDYQQGDTVRIMFVHVPAASVGLGIYLALGVSSFFALVFRHPLADAAAWLRRRLGLKGGKTPAAATRYWLLGFVLVIAAATGSLAWEWVNPVSMFHRGLIFGFGLAWGIVGGIFFYDLLIAPRGWCGHLCPQGAFYALLGRAAVVKISADKRSACNDCMDCFAVCPEPQVIRPALKGVGQDHPLILDADCTTCGRCVDVCGKDVFRITTRFNRSES